MISLRFYGRANTLLDDLPITIQVAQSECQMEIRRGKIIDQVAIGRCQHRLILAAKRALLADAALSWRIKHVPSGVRLGLCQPVSNSLAARMCLPHLQRLDDLPLYGYQRSGVARLVRSRRLMLADDMGLGKTIQVAGAIRLLIANGRIANALVIAPATLLANWVSELAKWTPELVVECSGTGNRLDIRKWSMLTEQCHVIVTNYEGFRVAMQEEGSLDVDLLVVDEAHRLKNWGSYTSRAIRGIHAGWTWVLTGTPLERDAEDLTNLLAFLDRDAFTRADASLPVGVLRSRAARFVLRREKGQVLGDLPPVTRKHEILSMGNTQADAYMRAVGSRSGDSPLAQFNHLRTICDYDPDTGESIKVERIVTILKESVGTAEKAVIFSYILKPLDLIRVRLQREGIGSELIVGSMTTVERREALRRFREGDSQVLLASMRIASEGLTLVEANHVLFVNRWWNPSLNQQAADRVLRIGQHRRVFIYTFTLSNTIEEDLDRLLDVKGELFDELIRRLRSGSVGVMRTLSRLSDVSGRGKRDGIT